MIERLGKNIFDHIRYRKLDTQASKEARKHYITALDKVTSLSSNSFWEFWGNQEKAKERMKLSLIVELGSLGAQKEASTIIEANKSRNWPRTLIAEERFRYRK